MFHGISLKEQDYSQSREFKQTGTSVGFQIRLIGFHNKSFFIEEFE